MGCRRCFPKGLGTLLRRTCPYWLKKGCSARGRALDRRPKEASSLGFCRPLRPGSGGPRTPLLREAATGRALPLKSFVTVEGMLPDLSEPQCPHLHSGHNTAAVLLKELDKISVPCRTRGRQSGAGGDRLPAPCPISLMGTSENGEGFYPYLDSWHAGSQARPPGSRHRHGTTEGPAARK